VVNEMSFKEFAAFIAPIMDAKMRKFDDDQFYLVCGKEGRGKSTFSIALQCEIYRILGKKPNPYHIIFNWQEYVAAHIQILNKMIQSGKFNDEYVKEYLQYFDLNFADDPLIKKAMDVDYMLNQNDIIVYDEAGTQHHAREAMGGQSIDLNKTLILDRFLNIGQLFNVPKPSSLDSYAREQRPRGMFWCSATYGHDENGVINERLRDVVYYTEETYSDILTQKQWWKLFANDRRLIKNHPPDIYINVRGDNLTNYIPKEILDRYKAKKLAFGVKQLRDIYQNTMKRGQGGFNEELMVRQGESKREWWERMKASGISINPDYYTKYNIYGKQKKVRIDDDSL
jgi:hypothetical protein